MKVLENISELETIKKRSILSIGNFDGVHTGHREILSAAKKIAVEKGVELTAMTFEPHPVAVLYPERAQVY